MRASSIILWILILAGVLGTRKATKATSILERCRFPIAGEIEWWAADGSLKPGVEADLVSRIDVTIPTRTTWTAKTLTEAVMKQYKPKCSFAAMDRVLEELKIVAPTEMYSKARLALDTMYALAQQRLEAAYGTAGGA